MIAGRAGHFRPLSQAARDSRLASASMSSVLIWRLVMSIIRHAPYVL